MSRAIGIMSVIVSERCLIYCLNASNAREVVHCKDTDFGDFESSQDSKDVLLKTLKLYFDSRISLLFG